MEEKIRRPGYNRAAPHAPIGRGAQPVNGEVVTNPDARAKTDYSIRGWKTMMKKDPIATRDLTDRIIKNTYRTLMTRGMKGCYIWSADEVTRDWFR